ncbi:MAG: hypothetical protein NZ888_07120 [Candidatus Nitrosocaldus sp.]|nr:hypothetical protein [Candidatus Nitrosocaldus sp.]MDW8000423.1 hypothetical protein [Candidatus Nitrosocaldus sp.]
MIDIACVPYTHEEGSRRLKAHWKDSSNVIDLYFATVTMSNEFRSYFTEYVNHCLIATYSDVDEVVEDVYTYVPSSIAMLFSNRLKLLDRPRISRLNFVSVNVLKRGYGKVEVKDLESVFQRKQWRIKSANLARMLMLPEGMLRFTYPYADNILLLQLDSDESHISEQRYCEKVRLDVIRRGIYVEHIMSLSILEQLK